MGKKLSACVSLHRSSSKKFSPLSTARFLITTVAMMDSESHPRPRRTRHNSSKHYDVERKDLELSQVLDVLQCYVDYGGGINCSICGKLAGFQFSPLILTLPTLLIIIACMSKIVKFASSGKHCRFSELVCVWYYL